MKPHGPFTPLFLSDLKLKVPPSPSKIKAHCQNVCEFSNYKGLILWQVPASSTQSLQRVISCFNWGNGQLCFSCRHSHCQWKSTVYRTKEISRYLFVLIVFCKVTANTELRYTEPLLLGETGFLGSYEPLVTTFSSTNKYIALFNMFLLKDILFNIYCWFIHI